MNDFSRNCLKLSHQTAICSFYRCARSINAKHTYRCYLGGSVRSRNKYWHSIFINPILTISFLKKRTDFHGRLTIFEYVYNICISHGTLINSSERGSQKLQEFSKKFCHRGSFEKYSSENIFNTIKTRWLEESVGFSFSLYVCSKNIGKRYVVSSESSFFTFSFHFLGWKVFYT